MLKITDVRVCTRILAAATPKRLLAPIAASLVALGPNVAPMYPKMIRLRQSRPPLPSSTW
jgi:hypothetical protein